MEKVLFTFGIKYPTLKNNLFSRQILSLWKILLNFIQRYFCASQFCQQKKMHFSVEKLDPDWKMYFCYSAKLTLKCFHTFFSQGHLCSPKKVLFTAGINLSDWKKQHLKSGNLSLIENATANLFNVISVWVTFANLK